MLVKTPPMGWNSWNTFGENITESLIMETADAMVSTGLKDAGYEYIVIDDCWSLRSRDENGRIVADPEKFPHGMKHLADYIHSLGLKFGMYSCAGTKTCAGYPSSFDLEFEDAKQFAEIGIDYLKYDFCFKPNYIDGPLLYRRMGMALKASGRDILFSACNWGSDNVHQWIRSAGADMFRSTGDINDSVNSFKEIAIGQIPLLGYSAPGCFNDIDMLIVGMYGKGNVAFEGSILTDDEYMMHFALWCMMSSPLMIGCDIRNMNQATKDILMNKALIAIDQDEEVRAPFAVGGKYDESPLILFRHLANNEYVLGLFNFHESFRDPFVELFEIGLPVKSGYGLELTDIFTGEKIPKFKSYVNLHIEGRTCRLFKAKVVEVQ